MTKSRNFSDPQESQSLQALLDKLKSIRNLLLYEADLRTIDLSIINTLEEDLRKITMEIERLRSNTSKILKSVDAFEVEIRQAREELYAASYALERSDKISNIRLFYRSLNNCGQHIDKALQLVVIDS
jgi:hypothetical protein